MKFLSPKEAGFKKSRLLDVISVVRPTLLYICFECFESSFPQSFGGNPSFFVS